MFRSLRLRLAIGNGLFLALLLSGLGLVGLQAYRTTLDDEATDELLAIAADYAGIVAAGGPAALPDHHLDPSDAAVLVGVFATDGTTLGGTGGEPDWLVPKATPVADGDIGGDPVRFVTESVRLPDGSMAKLVVARSLQRLGEAVDELWRTYLSGLIEVVLLSGLFGWWVSGRMIRPVARSYEAQRAFASDASHELRTPLTFIRAGVEVLAPSKPELGKQILDEVDYMASLTDRLLTLARAEDGRLEVEPAPFDLAAVCRASADRGRGAHGVALEVRGDGGKAVTAVGDPVLTATVLDALLENVARHGDGAAEIRCDNGGRTARVEISDRGRGIDTADAERLFDRFARLDASRARASGGAGLGLPLARALARAQGGDLRLSATPGGGLTATLELPAA